MQTLKAEITKLGTGDLEAYIDLRYESGAPQGELDALETAFAERVSEDENITEDEPNMSEAYDMGADLEEWLAIEYHQFIHPQERTSSRETRDYFSPACLNDFLSLNLKPTIKRKDILSAAKDVYEYKTQLIQRYKQKPKFSYLSSNIK